MLPLRAEQPQTSSVRPVDLTIAQAISQGQGLAGSALSRPAVVERLSLPSVYSDLYVLGPGDQLQLNFLDPAAKDVGGPIEILPDGTSTLALLGSVQLTGLTLGQASRWLTSLYGKQLVRPQLNLNLIRPRPVQVSVLGEVGRPGLYPLPSYSTPVSAIQTAGGITLNADIRKIVLRRPAGAGGFEKQTVLDLAQLLQAGNQRQNPILFDGDTVIVTRSETPVPSEVIQIGLSNLSPISISVTMVGEVKSPGTLAVPANTPLQEALLRAGGPVPWRAKKTNIELVRLNRNGTTTTEYYSYQPGQDISKGFNPPLRDRDMIIVRRSYYGKAVDLINQVVAPLSSLGSTFFYLGNYNRN
ncbi:MAG: polysaccharide biosynthesis/export family protein [Synechococcaceae cyanobacterium ELA182]